VGVLFRLVPFCLHLPLRLGLESELGLDFFYPASAPVHHKMFITPCRSLQHTEVGVYSEGGRRRRLRTKD